MALRVFGFLAALFVASLSSSAPAAAGGSGCYGYDCHYSGYYYVLVQQSPCGSCGRGLVTSTWSPCGYTRCQPAIVIPTTCGGCGGYVTYYQTGGYGGDYFGPRHGHGHRHQHHNRHHNRYH